MTYVDDRLESNKIIPFRTPFPRVRSWIARAEDGAARSFLTFNSFFSYLVAERGPTSSASLLAYNGIAAAGAVLYEAWYTDEPYVDRPRSGLVGDRGSLRRLADELHLKAANELEVHRKIVRRSFAHQRRRV
jgi:hypothetical protein